MQTDNNSNKTLLEDLLAKASKQWGVAPEEIQKAMDKIAFHESKGVVDAIQKSDKNKTSYGYSGKPTEVKDRSSWIKKKVNKNKKGD